jgi:staphyloferrin B biosynthesis citrate synthase
MSDAAMNALVNPVIERMKAGEVALGMSVRLARSGDIASIARTTGHDFLFLDAQHAIFSLETLAHIAQAARGAGVAPLVRVRSCDDPDTSLLLDAGVTGIVFPDINTAAQARKAVDTAKFAPLGKRSVSGTYSLFDFRPLPLAEVMRALNENTLVVCMIETREGLANVEAIAAIEGVDVLHVGCNDLLADMGKPGAFGDPEIVAAVEQVIAVAHAHGKFAGLGGERNVARQIQFIRKGVKFMTTQTDIGFLMAEASRRTGELRHALAAEAG